MEEKGPVYRERKGHCLTKGIGKKRPERAIKGYDLRTPLLSLYGI